MSNFNLAYKIFEKGYEKGFVDMEIYISGGKSFNARVFKQEVDHFALSMSEGLSFRGIHPNGKVGYSFTEKLTEESIEILVESAWSNAEFIEIDEQDEILKPATEYKEIKNNTEQNEVEVDLKLKKLLEMEEYAKKLDNRIESLNYCMHADSVNKRNIINTKGMNLSDEVESFMYYISVIAKENDEVITESDFILSKDFNNIDRKKFIETLVEKAIKKFGGINVKSASYPVVLENQVMATLLDAYKSIFSAESVQNGKSMLKGKIGENIAKSNITIGDNPYMTDSILNISFDDEGAPTFAKKVIENGKLISFFHNSKTAKKDNVKTTGNASKASYKSQPTVGMWNLYLESKEDTFEEIVQKAENGIFITQLSGVHAGVNPISGDFSLEAKGYLIENGTITKPIKQMTVAGNFIEMLRNITCIANDTKMNISLVFSPSVLVENLDVSGV